MKPSYRVVVTDSQSPRDGRFIEILGHFDPCTNPETVVIDEERAINWLQHGAQATVTAGRLLTKTGIMDKFKASKVARTGQESKEIA